MKHLRHIPLLATILTLLASCGKDRTGEFYALIEDRMWMEETMLAHYLWYQDMTPTENENDYFQEPATFFKKLLSKEAMNGKGDKYSYMEKDPETDGKARSTTLDRTSTYGMEFVLTNDPTGTTNHTYARVLYTLPGSPAAKAGIKRGDWLCAIDGQRITSSNYTRLVNGGNQSVAIAQIAVTDEGAIWQTADTLMLTPSVQMEINPFLIDTLYEAGGQKIAYLMYNEFSTGPENLGAETTYIQQMKQIFAQFKSAHPHAFILDLRYNNGGFMQCAQALGSLLAPASALGKNFATLTFNDKTNPQTIDYTLDPQYADANLNLDKIYILTGELTASASEAVINGLIPHMGAENIILVGTRTVGKNVAMQSFRNDTYGLTLWPVVAYLSNAEGEGDYSNGFAPTHEMNELNIVPWYPLGDTREYMLRNAISLITTGTMPNLQESTRAISTKNIMSKVSKPITIVSNP